INLTTISGSHLSQSARQEDFYDRQQEGIGDYFVDSILADAESLVLYAGVHSTHFGRGQAFLQQHFLNFFPLPQGQGSLRPTPGRVNRGAISA
ncbi:MAG: hypothetical protein WD342_04355, partial [Verrucomicrobiales bacterium]